jgi:rubrerythrin
MDINERMKSALKQAIQFEADGIDYYKTAAEKTNTPFIKKVFEELIEDEKVHINVVREIHDRLLSQSEWKATKMDPKPLTFQSIFKQEGNIPESAKDDDLKAIQHAVDMEEKGMNMYKDLSEKAENEAESKFYDLLHKEEVKHRAVLNDTLEYLKDPNAWQMKHGKASLDGA